MATRALIGMKMDDGIDSVYLHHDGYPEGAGKTLKESYAQPMEVVQLINLGDLSELKDSTAECVAFGRDRGETDVAAIEHADLTSFLIRAKSLGCQYGYVYDLATRRWDTWNV